MKRTSILSLIWLVSLGALGGYLIEWGWRHLGFQRSQLPFGTAVAVLLLAVVIGYFGWQVSRYKAGKSTWINGSIAMQVALVSLASSRGGAVFIGAFSLRAVKQFLEGSTAWFKQESLNSLLVTGACIALVVCALTVERICALSDDDDNNNKEDINSKVPGKVPGAEGVRKGNGCV